MVVITLLVPVPNLFFQHDCTIDDNIEAYYNQQVYVILGSSLYRLLFSARFQAKNFNNGTEQ
jgi:hypothetical protein